MGAYIFFMNFFLSGEAQKQQNSQSLIQHNNQYMMPSINSKAQYKLGTLGNKNMKALYTPGIIEEDYLKHQLLKECKTTSQLIALSKKLSQQAKKEKSLVPVSQSQKSRTKKSRAVSRSSAKKVPRKKRKKEQTSSSSSSSKESTSSKSSTTSSD